MVSDTCHHGGLRRGLSLTVRGEMKVGLPGKGTAHRTDDTCRSATYHPHISGFCLWAAPRPMHL